MKIKTWSDRITDESNLWFNAIKMEDGQDLHNAIIFYIKDATECLKDDLYLRAALSCICAADCLSKSGYVENACQLHSEAALIYEKNADRVIGKSIRESLWSLQEAYENFLLASNYSKAQQIFDKYLSLTRKLNPFGESDAMNVLQARKNAIDNVKKHITPALKKSNEISTAIHKLTYLRLEECGKKESHVTCETSNQKRKESK
jgi:hypothetical protein